MQQIRIPAHGERRGGVPFEFVMKVNHAGIERNNLSYLVDQHRQSVLDFE